MWCGKVMIKSFIPHLLFLSPASSLHLSPSWCSVPSTGGAVWVHALSLFCYTFYSPLKGLLGIFLLVQSVSKLPRLPFRFFTSSPPWDWALYVLLTRSECQVSCITTQFLCQIFILCLYLCLHLHTVDSHRLTCKCASFSHFHTEMKEVWKCKVYFLQNVCNALKFAQQ